MIDCIEDPQVIDTILSHLTKKEEKERITTPARAPPAITQIEERLVQLTTKR